MSFKHKFPTSVTMIGYIEKAKALPKTKNNATLRVRASLYNPSEQFRTPGKILLNVEKTGELVSVIGRLVMAKGKNGTKLEVLVERIKSLDEEQDYGVDEALGEQ